MTGAAVVLAFNSALCFGVALVLTHIGLRYIAPLTAAAISIPSSTLLFIAIAPLFSETAPSSGRRCRSSPRLGSFTRRR